MAKLLSWMLLALSVLVAGPALAQEPRAAPTVPVESQSLATPTAQHFDADKATDAYLARISGDARARSDSYFEGGYVLLFVDAIYMIVVCALLLFLRVSARMRRIAERITRSRFLQAGIYIALFLILTTLVVLPLSIYEGYVRERSYGLSNQDFAGWFGEFGLSFAIQLIVAFVLGSVMYAVIRRTKQYWWVWATVVTVLFGVFAAMIAPVYIAPLFNTYTPLKAGPVKDHILSLARSEGIPVDNVYEFDASKQSKRVSANVSGMFGTTRISLNDNLLKRSSEREIQAVLGHEMGHYVLDHGMRLVVLSGLVALLGFGFTAWGFNILLRVFGGIWDVRGVEDPAGLPVLAALLTFFYLLATPISNTIIRTTEAQADIFGVNAARQPDGFAEAALKLSEYRKLDPSPFEEFVFFDHPSGRNRISMMMHWKAEHLNDPDIKTGPVSPQ